eukprot:7434253-Alexandrium_andersonii.AAC.1
MPRVAVQSASPPHPVGQPRNAAYRYIFKTRLVRIARWEQRAAPVISRTRSSNRLKSEGGLFLRVVGWGRAHL